MLSIGLKVFLYFYNTSKSKRNHLLSLRAVAMDSFSDAVSTMAVLLSLILNTLFGFTLDGFFGTAVSLLIIYNAIKSASKSIRSIVGTAASESTRKELAETVEAFFDSPVAVTDLKISDYGYNRHTASFHMVSNDKVQFSYDSMIQVEKTIAQTMGNAVIERAEKSMINAGYSYALSDARVLNCENGTYQLVASIVTPWLEKKEFHELCQFASQPKSFGLSEKDSVLIKIILGSRQSRTVICPGTNEGKTVKK